MCLHAAESRSLLWSIRRFKASGDERLYIVVPKGTLLYSMQSGCYLGQDRGYRCYRGRMTLGRGNRVIPFKYLPWDDQSHFTFAVSIVISFVLRLEERRQHRTASYLSTSLEMPTSTNFPILAIPLKGQKAEACFHSFW